jgi:hypothetical protein
MDRLVRTSPALVLEPIFEADSRDNDEFNTEGAEEDRI